MTIEQAIDILKRLGDGWRIEAYLYDDVLEFQFYCFNDDSPYWETIIEGTLESIEEEVKEIERNRGES